MQLSSAMRDGIRRLKKTSATPALDVELLLCHVLNKAESSWLFAHSEYALSSQQTRRWQALLEERRSGVPVAYLTGVASFFGRPFRVSRDVLIPRSETESLVTEAVEIIRASKHKNPCIADIGTGSGCIAVTLALEIPAARIIATDISSAALSVAKSNARAHNVMNRVEFRQGHLLDPLRGTRVDLLVSNPPYVPTLELAHHTVTRENIGLRFEPHSALDGGTDGTRYTEPLMTAGIPAVIESTGGTIARVGV